MPDWRQYEVLRIIVRDVITGMKLLAQMDKMMQSYDP